MTLTVRFAALLIAVALLTGNAVAAHPRLTLVQAADDSGGVQSREKDSLRVIPLPDFDNPTASGNQSESQQKIQLAQRLIRQRNYEPAERLLEVALAEDSANQVIQAMLLTCFLELKHHFKSEALLEEMLLEEPRNFNYNLMLAEVQSQMGEEEKALASYAVTMYLIPPDDTIRFLQLVSSQVTYGLEDAALYLIDSLRTATGDPRLLALPRAQVFEKQGKYDKAVDEYFPLLTEDTTRLAIEAERRIFAMLAFEGSAEATSKALQSRSERGGTARAMRLLATHYMATEDFDRAFDYSLKQDSLETQKGDALLYFMHQAKEKKRFDQVLRMGDMLMARYQNAPGLLGAYFSYAGALVQTERYDSAITIYHHIISISPSANDKAEALFQVGQVYAEHLNDCRTAIAVYDSVATSYRRGFGYINALREIPLCFIRLGELPSAEQAYLRLSALKVNDEVAEEILYHQGLIQFFEKEFDTAQSMFNRVIVEYPRGLFVNDALRLLMTVTEAEGNDTLLYDYAAALRFRMQRNEDSARVKFEDLVNTSQKSLADVSLLTLAEMALDRQDTTAALGNVERLMTEFPESYYVPFGVKLKADILVRKPATYDEAVGLYRQLLQAYPNFPESSEVRNILRLLNQQSIG
jgi:tetratricopeptide (TPR) repeat protein